MVSRYCTKLVLCWLFSLFFTSCVSDDTNNGIPVSAERYNLSPGGDGIVFNAGTDESDGLSYQWYRGNDSIFGNAELIEGATSATYNTGKIAKGIHYYFCVIKNGASATTIRPFSVAFTGLPLVEIHTVDNEEPTAEYVSYENYGGNYGKTLRNATKVPASMRITSEALCGLAVPRLFR